MFSTLIGVNTGGGDGGYAYVQTGWNREHKTN